MALEQPAQAPAAAQNLELATDGVQDHAVATEFPGRVQHHSLSGSVLLVGKDRDLLAILIEIPGFQPEGSAVVDVRERLSAPGLRQRGRRKASQLRPLQQLRSGGLEVLVGRPGPKWGVSQLDP
jgi:hypothetical protein